MKSTLFGLSLRRLVALSLVLVVMGVAGAGCRVTQEESGEAPEVEVEADPGELPEYDVDGPEVDVGTEEAEVTVPDVDVDTEETEVTVPDVDVSIPEDNEEAGSEDAASSESEADSSQADS